MPRRPTTRIRRLAGFALAALVAASFPAAAQARDMALAAVYDIYMGGIRIARADTHAAIAGPRYDARVGLVLQGIAATFAPSWSWTALAMGRVEEGSLAVERLDTVKTSSGETSRTSVLFHGAGAVEIRYDPPRDRSPSPGIPPAQLEGALDIVSAVLSVLHRQNSDGRCDLRVPVLDGRKLFIATAQTEGPAELHRPEQGIYGGPASHCALRLDPAAGRFASGVDPDSGQARDFFQSGRGEGTESRMLDVWFAAPEPDAPAVPVRIESDSPWGRIVIHLVAFAH